MSLIDTTVREGGQLACGGKRPQGAAFARGHWVAPTIFTGVTPSHTIWREEVFGPVMTITPFRDDAHALALANDSEYGLAAAVFTNSAHRLQHFTQALEAGVVWGNCSQPVPHQLPWGGVKKSGLGREMGPAALAPFLEMKAATAAVEPGARLGWYALQDLRRQ